jgi:hypothetical protein
VSEGAWMREVSNWEGHPGLKPLGRKIIRC